MTKYLNFTIPLLIMVLLVVVGSEKIAIDSKVFAQLPIPSVIPKSSSINTPPSAARSNNATMTIHTTNSIRGSKFIIKQEEPVIRKAI